MSDCRFCRHYHIGTLSAHGYCTAVPGRKEFTHGMRLPQGQCGIEARLFMAQAVPAAPSADPGRPMTEYERYLASPEWRETRRRVMTRARGICEGCGRSPAVEVHHLTYAHVRAEFLFELVALCGGCHGRIHNEKETKAA